jgi:hypothetical protein
VTPYPQPELPPRPSGTSSIVVLLVLMGLGGLLMIVVVSVLVVRGVARTRAAGLASGSPVSTAELPPVTRHVPTHALSILDGCSDADVQLVAGGIEDAIAVGAPLYNSGNFAGCYHLYDGAAADVERRLPASCPGPVRALEVGRKRAASVTDPSAAAWAMRDAFDGLLDVVARRESSR